MPTKRKYDNKATERRCDGLIGLHMPAEGNIPDAFPSKRYNLQQYIKIAAESLGLEWKGGDVVFPPFLAYMNRKNATVTKFWDSSEKWAARAICDHLKLGKVWSHRLIDALNHALAMAITGFKRSECIAMCGECKTSHNFALDGLSLCFADKFRTTGPFCYPVTPNVVRENVRIRHPAYSIALHAAAPTLSIEHQWAYALGWTLYERADGARTSVTAPAGFPRHDEFVRDLRVRHLHAGYVIARACKKHVDSHSGDSSKPSK